MVDQPTITSPKHFYTNHRRTILPMAMITALPVNLHVTGSCAITATNASIHFGFLGRLHEMERRQLLGTSTDFS